MTDPHYDVDFVRIRSDYLGAGAFLALDRDRLIAVNTQYGVQALDLDGKELWKADLVERCIGLAAGEDETIVASTLHALHVLSRDGEILSSRPIRYGLTRAPVPWGGGYLVATPTRVYCLDDAGDPRWRYRLRESLGSEVPAVYVNEILPRASGMVVGAVDADSGIGRVIVFDEDGNVGWQSSPGPLTDIFPVGDDEFVYTLTGYGRFESCRANCAGNTRWTVKDSGGPGVELPDGRLATINGTNESPAGDNWEFRVLDADGATIESQQARGRACHPPVVGPDGGVYFTGFCRPIDPAESRIDYGAYVRPPRFVANDYLLQGRAQQEFDIFFCRFTSTSELQILFRDNHALALGPTVAGVRHVFFAHGHDILAIATESLV